MFFVYRKCGMTVYATNKNRKNSQKLPKNGVRLSYLIDYNTIETRTNVRILRKKWKCGLAKICFRDIMRLLSGGEPPQTRLSISRYRFGETILLYRIEDLATLCGKPRTVYRPRGEYLYNAECIVQNAELWKNHDERYA